MFKRKILSKKYIKYLKTKGTFDERLYIYSLPRSGKNIIIHWISSQHSLPICVKSKNFISLYGNEPKDYHFNLLISHHEWFTLNQIKKHNKIKKL
jgi:hypothetical protein